MKLVKLTRWMDRDEGGACPDGWHECYVNPEQVVTVEPYRRRERVNGGPALPLAIIGTHINTTAGEYVVREAHAEVAAAIEAAGLGVRIGSVSVSGGGAVGVHIGPK